MGKQVKLWAYQTDLSGNANGHFSMIELPVDSKRNDVIREVTKTSAACFNIIDLGVQISRIEDVDFPPKSLLRKTIITKRKIKKIMKQTLLLFLFAAITLVASSQERLQGGIHAGAGMGYDTETLHPAFQLSLGANVNHIMISLNKTFPFSTTEAPTLLQAKLGYIIGSTGPKAIFYGGIIQRTMDYKLRFSQSMELYPERYIEYQYEAFTYGIEFSTPLVPKTRLCLDLNFSSKPLEKDKEQFAKTYVQFLPMLSFKALLGKKDDCYPRPNFD